MIYVVGSQLHGESVFFNGAGEYKNHGSHVTADLNPHKEVNHHGSDHRNHRCVLQNFLLSGKKVLMGTAVDITERKQFEEELRRSEELTHSILEAVPGGIIEVAQDGGIIQANIEAQHSLGLSALDFLTKPVDKEELAAALARLREKLAQKTSPANRREQFDLLFHWIEQAQHQPPARDQRIALPTAQDIRFVAIGDIVRVESDNNYSTFFLQNREKIVVSRTLKEYERLLESHGFWRTSRSNLVNLAFVSRFLKSESAVAMTDGSTVEVAANKKEELLRRLAG